MNEPNESELLAADAVPSGNRHLSILDFMLAMVALAVALGLRQNLPQFRGTINPQDPFWSALFSFYRVGFYTLILFGIALLVKGRWATARQQIWHPGHLLLIAQLTSNVLLVVVAGLLDQPSGITFTAYYIITHIGSHLVVLVILSIGIFTFRKNRWWAACFSMLAISYLSFLYLGLGLLIWPSLAFPQIDLIINSHRGAMLLSFLIAVVSVVFDIRRSIPRDLAHWLGIASLFGSMLIGQLLFMLVL